MYVEKTKKNRMRTQKIYEQVNAKIEKTKENQLISEITNSINRDKILVDISFLLLSTMSMSKAIYEVLTDEQKDNIPEDVRALIENGIDLYTNTLTIMDVALQNGDSGFIVEPLRTQSKMAEILQKVFYGD